MSNDNPVYEPGIYLTPEEVEHQATKHRGNPIIQQLLYLTRQSGELIAALQDIALTAQQAGMHQPEQFCQWAYHRAEQALGYSARDSGTP
jgi:hypothetical protein